MLSKIIAAFILASEVCIFAMLPFFNLKLFSNNKIMDIFNSFSAGLFMGISFLHIIPEANESVTNWLSTHKSSLVHLDESGHHHQIPYGTLISLITFLLVLSIETYLSEQHHENLQNKIQKNSASPIKEIDDIQKLKKSRKLVMQTYLTQMALSIHSFFQCMSIGIEKQQSVTITLAGAIIFHKWAQALTLGFSYKSSGMPKHTALKFALFHATLNAAAVIIGYQLSNTNQLVKGFTNAISGGTFIYICMIQKISKQFVHKQGLATKLGLVLAGLSFSIMILN